MWQSGISVIAAILENYKSSSYFNLAKHVAIFKNIEKLLDEKKFRTDPPKTTRVEDKKCTFNYKGIQIQFDFSEIFNLIDYLTATLNDDMTEA